MHVFIRSETNLYTVGHYDPRGNFISMSDHESKAMAEAKVNYLNGGSGNEILESTEFMHRLLQVLENIVNKP